MKDGVILVGSMAGVATAGTILTLTGDPIPVWGVILLLWLLVLLTIACMLASGSRR
jgi:hypothetical protein